MKAGGIDTNMIHAAFWQAKLLLLIAMPLWVEFQYH